MSLSNRPSVQHTMFDPVRAYQKYVQRLELKRKVFNTDKKTLNLQELNRFVNGTPEKLRTKPTYLRAKTRDLLWNTLVTEWGDGKYGKDLDEVANDLIHWCKSPDRAQNKKVRHWLKQLAEAKPVGRPAVESDKIPTWTVAQLIKDFGGDEGTHGSPEDVAQFRVSPKGVAPSHGTSEEDFDWSAALHEATNAIECAIPNEVESGTKHLGGSTGKSASIDSSLSAEDDRAFAMSIGRLNSGGLTELRATDADEARHGGVALDESKHENDPHDLFERVDAKIEKQRRRPAPMLRPPKSSTQPLGRTVVRVVGEHIVPGK